jgi:hypothetical protein
MNLLKGGIIAQTADHEMKGAPICIIIDKINPPSNLPKRVITISVSRRLINLVTKPIADWKKELSFYE